MSSTLEDCFKIWRAFFNKQSMGLSCCPYCGGPAGEEKPAGGGPSGQIYCKDECFVSPYLYFGRQYRCKDRQAAAAFWNKRVT